MSEVGRSKLAMQANPDKPRRADVADITRVLRAIYARYPDGGCPNISVAENEARFMLDAEGLQPASHEGGKNIFREVLYKDEFKNKRSPRGRKKKVKFDKNQPIGSYIKALLEGPPCDPKSLLARWM